MHVIEAAQREGLCRQDLPVSRKELLAMLEAGAFEPQSRNERYTRATSAHSYTVNAGEHRRSSIDRSERDSSRGDTTAAEATRGPGTRLVN
jgi:hypothetical protein